MQLVLIEMSKTEKLERLVQCRILFGAIGFNITTSNGENSDGVAKPSKVGVRIIAAPPVSSMIPLRMSNSLQGRLTRDQLTCICSFSLVLFRSVHCSFCSVYAEMYLVCVSVIAGSLCTYLVTSYCLL